MDGGAVEGSRGPSQGLKIERGGGRERAEVQGSRVLSHVACSPPPAVLAQASKGLYSSPPPSTDSRLFMGAGRTGEQRCSAQPGWAAVVETPTDQAPPTCAGLGQGLGLWLRPELWLGALLPLLPLLSFTDRCREEVWLLPVPVSGARQQWGGVTEAPATWSWPQPHKTQASTAGRAHPSPICH